MPFLTVEENVTYPMELRGVNGQEARDKAHQLIDKVDLPETVLNRLPGMLSGGEQQRVAYWSSFSDAVKTGYANYHIDHKACSSKE